MRVGFSDFSLFSGRTSKFFGIIEFLGGRSSFFGTDITLWIIDFVLELF